MSTRCCTCWGHASASSRPLPRAFYLRPAPAVARDLLGCVLVSRRGRATTAGRIVEVEAYLGPEDEASHAAFRPGSHAIFYGEGGRAYVYLNYGIHHCLNAITNPAGRPGCVLIRALEPVAGAATMARRRGVAAEVRRLASGPGNVTRALGLSLRDNRADLTRGPLVILPRARPHDFTIARGRRVGITRSMDLPLRFWIAGSPFVSGVSAARAAPSRSASPRTASRGDAGATRRRARPPRAG